MEMPNTLGLAASKVVRVVIAGNSVRAIAAKQRQNASAMILRTIDTTEMLKSIKLLDDFVANLAQSVDVDLMPGEFDPSNHMMPQQPIHHCMFPKAAINRSFSGVPNPYQFNIEERLILGTSGQNIDDVRRYTNIESPIECMKNILHWSHIAPTCPDTLPCYPFLGEDPFIIDNCPHVFFCGQNSETFRTELHESKLLLIFTSALRI